MQYTIYVRAVRLKQSCCIGDSKTMSSIVDNDVIFQNYEQILVKFLYNSVYSSLNLHGSYAPRQFVLY